ncbi:hypothetical protein Tco_1542129, partial [Tanacetum coccineum]
VQKQKELEKTLQNRYGDLLIEQERIHNLMEKYRQEAIAQEAAQKQAEAEAAAAANREDTKMVEPEPEPQLREQVEEANQITDSSEMTNQTGQEDSAVVEKVNDESSNGQMDGPSAALHINDQDAGLSQSQQIDATGVDVQAPMEILAVDSGAPESNIEADAT